MSFLQYFYHQIIVSEEKRCSFTCKKYEKYKCAQTIIGLEDRERGQKQKQRRGESQKKGMRKETRGNRILVDQTCFSKKNMLI